MAEEIKIIDAEKGLIEITAPVKKVVSKEQLLRQKATLERQLAKINEIISKCP